MGSSDNDAVKFSDDSVVSTDCAKSSGLLSLIVEREVETVMEITQLTSGLDNARRVPFRELVLEEFRFMHPLHTTK